VANVSVSAIEQNAQRIGLSLREYVSRLVLKDTPSPRKKLEIFPVEHSWGPVPKAVNARRRAHGQKQNSNKASKKGLEPLRCTPTKTADVGWRASPIRHPFPAHKVTPHRHSPFADPRTL